MAALVAIGLAFASATSPAAQSPSAEVHYALGSGDVLNITVWGQGGLSDRFTVEGDGTFVFPMLGRVRAGGLTVRQLQDELTRQLGDGFFKDPHVTVLVDDYQSQHVLVVGEVRSPGKYTLKGPTTLLEALALAGAVTPNAGSLALVRREAGTEASVEGASDTREGMVEISVDLAALQGGVPSSNPVVRDGDTIVVPRATPVHVFGHVGRPGDYTVGSGATLRQVLALAGGVSQRGSTGRIKIIRLVDGREREIGVDLDDAVKPGDTIVVPERIF